MIPASVTAGVLAFQDAVNAAKPLRQAPGLQIAALVTQGHALLSAIDDAIGGPDFSLDAEIVAAHPLALIELVRARADAAEDQRTLSDLRGYLGRAVLNVSQRVI